MNIISDKKKNLLGLSKESLVKFFADIEEPSFRADQITKWIHQKGVTNFYKMTNLKKSLQDKLSKIAYIKPPKIIEKHESKEGTIKYLIELHQGGIIEMVRIPEQNRITLCISSQAGCALQCTFCATGAQGFQSNLLSEEIIGQLWLANFECNENQRITNVVFMGMGEPLLNFYPVIESVKIMKCQHGYGLSRKRITISTSGITPMIDKLAENVDVSLAVSLHAPNDELRNEIVPINKKYPINELLKSCKKYLASFKNKRTITIEYILIDGINDTLMHAKQLSKLLSSLSCKINLIPFNSFAGSTYKRSNSESIKSFRDMLVSRGYITTLRITRGDAIDGACGQLVGALKNPIVGNKITSYTIY